MAPKARTDGGLIEDRDWLVYRAFNFSRDGGCSP